MTLKEKLREKKDHALGERGHGAGEARKEVKEARKVGDLCQSAMCLATRVNDAGLLRGAVGPNSRGREDMGEGTPGQPPWGHSTAHMPQLMEMGGPPGWQSPWQTEAGPDRGRTSQRQDQSKAAAAGGGTKRGREKQFGVWEEL